MECFLGSGFASEDGLHLIGAFESSPFDGQTVSGAGEVPIGAVAIGIDVAKVISPGHVLGAGPGDRGEAGIVEESFSFLPRMSSHEPGHFTFFSGPSVARDGAGVTVILSVPPQEIRTRQEMRLTIKRRNLMPDKMTLLID